MNYVFLPIKNPNALLTIEWLIGVHHSVRIIDISTITIIIILSIVIYIMLTEMYECCI